MTWTNCRKCFTIPAVVIYPYHLDLYPLLFRSGTIRPAPIISPNAILQIKSIYVPNNTAEMDLTNGTTLYLSDFGRSSFNIQVISTKSNTQSLYIFPMDVSKAPYHTHIVVIIFADIYNSCPTFPTKPSAIDDTDCRGTQLSHMSSMISIYRSKLLLRAAKQPMVNNPNYSTNWPCENHHHLPSSEWYHYL
jgi:hypothetical protein